MLSIPSIFIGYLTKDMIIGLGTDFWGNAIYILPEHMNLIDAEFVEHKFKLIPLIFSLSGAFLSFILYLFFSDLLFQLKVSNIGRVFYNFLNRKWFFDKLYNELIVQFFFKFGYSVSYKIIDRGIIEIFGPMGLSNLFRKKSYFLKNLQTGYIYHYTFLILVGSTIMLGARQFWILVGDFIDYRVSIIIFLSSFFCIIEKN